MSAPTRKRHLVRTVTFSLAAVVVAMGVYLAVSWRALRLRWLCEQLEAAETFEEARVPLEAIGVLSKVPTVGRDFVALLGPGRPRTTFWLFTFLTSEEALRGVPGEKLPPRHGAVPCHLSEPFAGKLFEDGALLGLWGQYTHWRWGRALWPGLDSLAPRAPNAPWVLFADGLRGAIYDGLEDALPSQEVACGLSRAEEARLLFDGFRALHAAEAWLAGLDVSRLEDASLPIIDRWNKARAASQWMTDQLRAWVTERRHRLRFDPAQGRCVLLPLDAPDDPRRFQDRGYAPPAVPWLGWNGPVPAVPELNG